MAVVYTAASDRSLFLTALSNGIVFGWSYAPDLAQRRKTGRKYDPPPPQAVSTCSTFDSFNAYNFHFLDKSLISLSATSLLYSTFQVAPRLETLLHLRSQFDEKKKNVDVQLIFRFRLPLLRYSSRGLLIMKQCAYPTIKLIIDDRGGVRSAVRKRTSV